MIIAFDFDSTIAKSTRYHRHGWEMVINEMSIPQKLDDILPYVPNLKTRFDSYERLKMRFLNTLGLQPQLSAYFNSDDTDTLVKKLMSLKESFTISQILSESLSESLRSLAVNLIPAVEVLRGKNLRLGIISSTRETIICSLLDKCNLLSDFSFIVGEESLTDEKGVLHDKPDSYAASVVKQNIDYYIGDNPEIDKEFADNCGFKYIFADYKYDFLNLIGQIHDS